MFTPTLNKKASQFTERLVFVDVESIEIFSNLFFEDINVLCILKQFLFR